MSLLGYLGVAGIIGMTPSVHWALGKEIAEDHFHKQFILYSVLWSFVLMSAINVNGMVQRFFSIPALRFYGALSFSIYLFHLIFVGALARLDLNSQISAWLVVAASTISSYISFTVLEGPVSRYSIVKLKPVTKENVTNG